MHKRLSFFTVALILLIWGLFVTPKIYVAHATPHLNFDITKVRGTITGPDGKPFKHADVTVTCDGETKSTKTGGNGWYNATFHGINTCDEGDTAYITASKDGISGSATGVVVEKKDGRFVDRNFSIINFSVPEFGLFTGAIALIGSAGTFYALRKRV